MNLAMQRHMAVYAREMLDREGLRDWRFKFNTNKSRRGVCKYNKRMVEVSVYVTLEGEDAVKEVIAHEIAHAVVGGRHNHDYVWRQKAISLGADGNRCGDNMQVEAKYVAICPACQKEYKRHRRPRRNGSCSRCSGGRYNPAYHLVFQENHNVRTTR